MPTRRLQHLFDSFGVSYTLIHHRPTVSSIDTAIASHVDSHTVAKAVIVRVDGRLAMAVIPASHKVKPDLLAWVAGVEDAEIAPECDFDNRFADCEPGALPPVGSLYGMKVYMDEELRNAPQILINAGSHTESLRLASSDLIALVRPTIGHISAPAAELAGHR